MAIAGVDLAPPGNARVFVMVRILLSTVVMLCQPFLLLIHVWALPVFLVGFVLFMILDHLPSFEERTKTTE